MWWMMEIKTLGELCNIASGGTPSRSKSEYWNEGTIPWIKIGNIKGKYVNEADEFITQEGLKSSSAKIFSKGTVLYTIFATLGEVGILNIEACTNQAIAGITIKNIYQLDTDYLYYYLKSKKKFVNNVGRGVAQSNINMSILKSFEIPLPNFVVQKKVVNVLDIVSSIIENYQQEIQTLDELIKSRFVEMFGDPISNPMGWNKKPLANECDIVTGNTPSRKVPEYYGDYIEWIKSDNINTPNAILTIAEEYLSEEGLKVGRSVDAGAILMTCIAGSIGCIGNVAIANRTVSFNQQINGIVPKRNNTWFMYVLFELSKGGIQSAINMALKGILSKGQLAEMEFIFPPVKLQNEFGDFVEQIDKLKVVAQEALDETQKLFNSLMQQYFG
ncbi:MAG: restriction endonuclease subunit S [Lachnospiraceae bacterium]|nr:restriction endonuclease subunit S [Lachnospiraceae bacterium]